MLYNVTYYNLYCNLVCLTSVSKIKQLDLVYKNTIIYILFIVTLHI